MSQKEIENINLKKYKTHVRKFPWTLVIRIVTALIAIGIILYISEFLLETKAEQDKAEKNLDIEISNE